jgi:hypothetical protein
MDTVYYTTNILQPLHQASFRMENHWQYIQTTAQFTGVR